MGNVNTVQFPYSSKEKEEWLQDVLDNRILDFSRKVTHSQFIQHTQGKIDEGCLTDFPWSILEPVSLYEKINGSFNNIAQISPNLALRIPHVKYLNLSFNVIYEIPSAIALLFHLEELLLRGNKLSGLPDEVTLLKKLKLLDISYNQLRSLPKDIGKLASLSKLNVSHNQLTRLPVSLGVSRTLDTLLASSNQCIEPPQDICEHSETLLNYLRSRYYPSSLGSEGNRFPRVRHNSAQTHLSDDARFHYVQIQTKTSLPASRAKTPLLLPASSSVFENDVISDKIAGLIYGAVLGDTLGVATEYLPKPEIEFYYSSKRLSHENIVQDEHRSYFQKGKTTCVADLMLLVLETILQWSGVLDELELAQKLIDYSANGIKDLNQKPFITSNIINILLSETKFAEDPHMVAEQIAINLHSCVSEDLYGLPMAVFTAIPQFYNLEEVKCNAERVCKTTHSCSPMVECATVIAKIIAIILQGRHNSQTEITTMINQSCEKLNLNLELTDTYFPIRQNNHSLRECEIENILAATMYSVKCKSDFESALTAILFQGGQSRIYGTICGGILGCISGYKQLPSRWIKGLHSGTTAWLNDRINHLLDMMGLP